MTTLYFNNKPLVWVSVDEDKNGEWFTSLSPNFHDFLMPLEEFETLEYGEVPDGYFSR